MKDAETSINGQRVRFGAGLRTDIGQELMELHASRALVLSTPHQSDMAMEVAANLGERAAGVITCAAMHTPVNVTEDALAYAKEIGADSIVAVGGGSTIGLGKALALRTGLPQLAIPTTYAGSEATPILGQTENGVKTTLVDSNVLPRTIVYDPELVASLPVPMTITSSLNAIAHAAEALYAKDRSLESSELAIRGVRAFVDGLPSICKDPTDIEAREITLRGAWACGTVLGSVGMALHHKLCHTVGGSFDLPHAETHAVILPHAIHFNEVAVSDLLAPLAELFGAKHPGQALWDFAGELGAPMALKDLGLREAQIDRVVELALEKPYWNPRIITANGLRTLLYNAWAGNPPNA